MQRGIIKVSAQIVLDFLQLGDGGRIVDVKWDSSIGVIDICIEHHKMPETNDREATPIVCPVFTRYEDAMGHRVALREKLAP